MVRETTAWVLPCRTHPGSAQAGRKKKITDPLSVNHDGPPAKEVGAAGPGKGGHVRQKPRHRSLPRRRVTERAAGECCGVRSLGSDQPVVNILPHQGAKMTAQSEGGGVECGEEVQAWETKTASSLSPLMGSQGQRRGLVEGMEPPKPQGFGLIALEV